ncbi:hypothetical protein EYF80_056416 [Liparis tanakae]|uniref:Uncharacterized protein n=1 Tax=Liparis tanakae TaxID=230148 RepID=A0A4Z2EXW9_9TELE|nr:hypothetical protein EYF80_056416 [Liparis tanakae]
MELNLSGFVVVPLLNWKTPVSNLTPLFAGRPGRGRSANGRSLMGCSGQIRRPQQGPGGPGAGPWWLKVSSSWMVKLPPVNVFPNHRHADAPGHSVPGVIECSTGSILSIGVGMEGPSGSGQTISGIQLPGTSHVSLWPPSPH